jgi:hypothetical protein
VKVRNLVKLAEKAIKKPIVELSIATSRRTLLKLIQIIIEKENSNSY